ncbi:glycosyltransferase family 2 protein [Pelagibius litoralis]|uniref:Glycosyltransferase family 2 protein n=1 Tax=Pelagibius litoralis TaxID=374515 RepID=A0A967C5P0_9PROT|nr:glycosyltransferase family A protein [Pelagibius litoralis]NIA69015.1 glycosyltransferase family 2 protein [Pelagibius litoralis]
MSTPEVSLPTDIRITFGMIVLNGEPFLRYNLRGLYPYAHEIIVVEGAAPGACNIADPQGHSRDGTLAILRRFKEEEDPEDKLIIVTAEDEGYPDGFWPGEKDEQSRAYAKRASGNYLWQVDVDEFYRSEDIETVIALLHGEADITAVSFRQITFWGGFDYTAEGWYLRRGAATYHRLFQWGPGFDYVSHRPPTVHDDRARDLRQLRWFDDRAMAARGIYLYHYSLLLPKQVEEKCDYYQNAEWAQRVGALAWAQQVFGELRRPFRVHNMYRYPSWLERYRGDHPQQILQMRSDIVDGRLPVELRRSDDIERLLNSIWYPAARFFVKQASVVDLAVYHLLCGMRKYRFLHRPLSALRRLVRRWAF